nr:LOW QUALITY PROTEIN: translation initiation factor IF-2-like [Desmodus rotundus]
MKVPYSTVLRIQVPSKDRGKRFQLQSRGSAPGVPRLVPGPARTREVDPRHLCPYPASWARGRVTRVPRSRRVPALSGEARGKGGSARKPAISGGAAVPSYGNRARSPSEPGGLTIVFGEHINPRSDLRAPRLPPGGHSVSSEAPYRGPGPRCRREARGRSGLADEPGFGALLVLGLCPRGRPEVTGVHFFPGPRGCAKRASAGKRRIRFSGVFLKPTRAPARASCPAAAAPGRRGRGAGPPGGRRDWSGAGRAPGRGPESAAGGGAWNLETDCRPPPSRPGMY